MTEAEDKSLPEGEMETGDIIDSPGSVPEVRTQIPISAGLEKLFNGRQPTVQERSILAMSQEMQLYHIGLQRLQEWTDSWTDKTGSIFHQIVDQDYSAVDQLIDEIADSSPWDSSQFREILLRMAIDVPHGT